MNSSLSDIIDPDIRPETGIAVFNLGFRPFFLLAGISALLLIPLWIYVYTTGSDDFSYYGAVSWHSHEMIFGYSVAVISGFLLTAVRNWTGLQTPGGTALVALVALWLAGRVSPFFADALPHWLIAVVDTAFLPVLTIAIAIPLIRRRQKHNMVFLFVLAAMALANIMVHLQMLGFTQTSAKRGTYFAVYLIVLLITILGGRVIPFFTEKGIPGAETKQHKAVEYTSVGALLLLILLDLSDATPVAVVIVSILAAIAHGARLYGWYQKAVWSVPLLWVLHLGYAWLVTGLLLKALSAAGLVNPMLAIHAFTAGGIGTITLGMMARVSLGHTGRLLQVGSSMTWAFALVNMAGFARVFLPVIATGSYSVWIVMSGVLWSAAFLLFAISYTGVLLKPRVDGLPG
jgi:uncharacterized protein involved in response to NO